MALSGAAKRDYMRGYMAERRREAKAKKVKAAPILTFPSDSPVDPAGALAEWARAKLRVPAGHPNAGEPMELPAYLVDFFRDALQEGCTESLNCVARKNGKSAAVAVLVLGYLVGPLRRPGWRCALASLSREKASELRLQIESIATASKLEGVQFWRRSSPSITTEGGGSVDILSADKNAGAALGADLAVCDELGLMHEKSRAFVASLRSSVSARGGRFMSLSVHGDGPFIPEILARRGAPGLAVHLHQAEEGCALDDPKAHALANPGLGLIKQTSYMTSEAARCLATPSDQSSFRALDLNQPQNPATEMLCSVDDWQACVVPKADLPPRDGFVCIGFDCGGSSSMGALAAVWPGTGRAEVWGAFPGTPNLADRGTADSVGNLYCRMEARGELKVYEGRITPVGEFLKDCAARLAGERVLSAGADRYRKSEAIQAIEQAKLNWPMEWRGMGASARADGSHDVRATQRAILSRKLRTAESLLLEHAIKEAAIRRDGAGNPAIDQSRKRGRIDALSALVIAEGLAALAEGRAPRRAWRSLGVVAA